MWRERSASAVVHRRERATLALAVGERDSAKFYPQGLRCYVKPHPKSKRSRRFKLSPPIVAKIERHVANCGPDS